MALAVITYPSEQAVLTNGTAYTIAAYSAEDTALTIYKDGLLLGSMTSGGGGNFTYSWTPASNASEVQIKVLGDVTGYSQITRYTVDSANLISQDLTTWTKSNAGITITSGQTDPWGGTTAYKVSLPVTSSTSRNISATASSTPAEKLCGIDVWVKPYGGMNVLYVSSSGSSKGNFFDITTGQSKSTALYGCIVENGPNNDGWVRVRFARAAETYDTTSFPFYFCQVMDSIVLNIDSTTAAAGIGFYFCEPRFVADVVPYMSFYQKLSVRLYATSSGVEQWYYKHPTVDSASDMVTINDEPGFHGSNCFRVIKPSGWSSANKYKVVYMLPALTDDLEANVQLSPNPWELARDNGYATTHNVVIVVPYFKSSALWYGCKDDGTVDMHSAMVNLPTQFSIDWLSASTNPMDHMLVGYSKSGWAAISLLMRNPHKFGYAACWDGPFNNYFNQGDTVTAFGTQGQYDLYSPNLIADDYKSNYNTSRRIIVMGGNNFVSSYTNFLSTLNSNYIQFSERYNTEAKHCWAHAWAQYAFQMLMDLSKTTDSDNQSVDFMYFR